MPEPANIPPSAGLVAPVLGSMEPARVLAHDELYAGVTDRHP